MFNIWILPAYNIFTYVYLLYMYCIQIITLLNNSKLFDMQLYKKKYEIEKWKLHFIINY